MTKSLAYISIYLGLFGWLFGSDKKDKQDQTSANQENSSITEESLEEKSPIEEPQIQVPELFPDGLPLRNATIPTEVGHPSAQNCGTCHKFELPEKNKIGPSLALLFNRKIAAVSGYKYSKTLVKVLHPVLSGLFLVQK